jgi:hypothetical protein
VVDWKKIICNYITSGRFFVDLAASIPFEEILVAFMSEGSSPNSLKLLGLFKLVRLLRLGRIVRYLKFKSGFKMGLRMIQLLLGLLMLVHWIACFWYLLVQTEGDWVPPKDTDRPSTTDKFWSRTKFYQSSTVDRYLTVFYYAILTMVGNDLYPRNSEQTLISAFFIIVGAVVSAFIFGNMAAIMATMNKKSTHFDEQLDLVNATMRQMKLPEDMQEQVVKFMLHVQSSPDLHQDLDRFFSILNEPLRKQILYHLHAPLIKKVKIMQECSSVEQSFFVCNLKPVLFLPGDIIIREGEKGDNIYFMNKGEAQVLLRGENKSNEVIATLNDGCIFGEVAILTKLKRTATVKSVDYTNCAYLTRADV